jgi:hypothetical protein
MDYSQMLNDSFEYTKEALWGKWMKWILLIVSAIIFPLFLGYTMEVMRGKKPAPELQNWGKLFIDGLKLFVTELIYAIPIIILAVFLVGGSVLVLAGGDPGMVMAAIGALAGGLLVIVIIAILIMLVATIGYIRLARTDSIGEAFNFSAILDRIGKIGWGSYIVALIIIALVIWVIEVIFMLIPFVGVLLNLLFVPAYGIFFTRYITLIYDSVPS